MLKLSDLLYGKARRSKNSEFVIAEDENDTRILFLKIYDKGSGSKVEIDKEKAGNKIREDLRNERSELKNILKEELGLFKKEEEAVKTEEEAVKTKEESETLRFDFSEETDTISHPKTEIGRSKKKKKKEKSDTVQNKPATKFVIDE
jgi:hypothetical protein